MNFLSYFLSIHHEITASNKIVTMLRLILSRCEQHTSRLTSQRPILALSAMADTGLRCFSGGKKDKKDERSDEDEDTDLQDIYTDLFGVDDTTAADSPSVTTFANRDKRGEKSSMKSGGMSKDTRDSSTVKEVGDVPERLWSDSFEISDERWQTKMEFDDIPDWSPDFVSRISKERVQIHADGIPTLSSLAKLALPPSPFPHPGHGKAKEYAKLRKKAHIEHVKKEVAALAEPKISSILALSTWQEKQNAVDSLFESVEYQLRQKEVILSGHPLFGKWVEAALESYLRGISMQEETRKNADNGQVADEKDSTESHGANSILEEDRVAVPVFMDCYDSKDSTGQVVPQILAPLKPRPRDGPGRMVEEWELSAHDTTRRIMLRESTRKIARALEESPSSRVFVTGHRGVGKSAALAAIVASARKSGYIVLYMPDGNRLHRHGYYIRPNPVFKGLFDLPILSQEVCNELLTSHGGDMQGMEVDEDTVKQHFTEIQLEELEYSGGNISLIDLLGSGQSRVSLAAMCYTIAVKSLMNQEEKPFLMVLDEYNCYYQPGHYFHMEYDNNVRNAIPYDQINLFKPAMDVMALSVSEDPEEPLATPLRLKRGGVVVGVSESCAVARRVTDALTASGLRSESECEIDAPFYMVEVPRFSDLEVDHILANFESIGIGNLRCDRGETVMNAEGVAYLRMVSSCVGQELMDLCCY